MEMFRKMRGVELKYVRNAHAAGGCTHARLVGSFGGLPYKYFCGLGSLAAEVEARCEGGVDFPAGKIEVFHGLVCRGVFGKYVVDAVDYFVIFDDGAELSPFLVGLIQGLGANGHHQGCRRTARTREHAPAYLRGKGLRNRHFGELAATVEHIDPEGGSARRYIYFSQSCIGEGVVVESCQ